MGSVLKNLGSDGQQHFAVARFGLWLSLVERFVRDGI